MSTQPNPELWGKFVEAVKAGRVQGLRWLEPDCDGFPVMLSINDDLYASNCMTQATIDHLCAELRRWMEGKGHDWRMESQSLVLKEYHATPRSLPGIGEAVVSFNMRTFKDGTELDWHLQAALYALDKECKGL